MPLRMQNRFWARAAGAAVLTMLVVSVGARGVFAGSSAVLRPATRSGTAAQGAAYGHLYVLDVGTLAVYRYPLASDGLPATKPDGVLEPAGAKDPLGLAVDRSGHVFLADEELGTVTEFAAGATGLQAPIATLNLSHHAPFHLKMDDAERLYVEYGSNPGQAIAIFAKGARGSDPPISVIAPYVQPELAADYVVTPSGALYVLDWSMSASIVGYANPLASPSQPDVLMWLQGGQEFTPGYSMVFDDATSELYFQFSPQDIGHGEYMNFAARKLPYIGTQLDAQILSGRCPAQDGQSGGAAIIKQYLIVSCTFNPEVLVFRKDLFGERRPVEVIGRGTLLGPSQVAIGP